ncbi:DUF1800 domain-containing protein [Rhodoplanes roseus]|uniref:DUF1800 domain-containing protein n=1 Tax=Rhodoplanes roseus TaxID=29409 RepID=A0A327KUS1_9BRAD|nr:DUF1800 domain-containing protein [Rhodoplanes roseus]RAI42660.1 hypothetical protein CH341_18380 [Rhodoplanes roseus]
MRGLSVAAGAAALFALAALPSPAHPAESHPVDLRPDDPAPLASLSKAELALVDALTWGVDSATLRAFGTQGRDTWLKAQLRPAAGDRLPEAARARLEALPSRTIPVADLVRDFDARARAAAALSDPDQRAAARKDVQQGMTDVFRDTTTAFVLRALYSPDQLRERLVWFWLNHFNVHQAKANLRLLVGDYVDTAIRPHALGRFRDLVMATLRHPAMLRYLDNADNAAGRLNENYAREIMELHTMGVGSGYTQKDVEELARILTGAGIALRPDTPRLKPELQPLLIQDGLFMFNPARHDFVDKVLLGHAVKGRGFAEIEEAVDILCRQPATARRVARQLATWFVADDPPPALVDRMARRFTETDGDIAAVVEAMLRAPEFSATIGTRAKDPVRFVVSALRLAYDGKVIVNAAPVQGWLNRLGEGLFNHQTPDGYPLVSTAWTGPGQMTTRFEIARQIGSGPAGLFKQAGTDAPDQPAFPQLQNAVYFAALQARLSDRTRAALDRAVSPQDWNTLFLSSPEFMQ